MLERSSARGGGGGFARKAPGTEGESASSEDRDASFRKRQAGMLDVQGKGLSALRLGGRRGSVRVGGGPGGALGRRGSVNSVTAEELQVTCDCCGCVCLCLCLCLCLARLWCFHY